MQKDDYYGCGFSNHFGDKDIQMIIFILFYKNVLTYTYIIFINNTYSTKKNSNENKKPAPKKPLPSEIERLQEIEKQEISDGVMERFTKK